MYTRSIIDLIKLSWYLNNREFQLDQIWRLNVAKRKDADVIDAARLVAVNRLNEWIGLPFDVEGALRSLRQLPQSIRRGIKEEGFLGWVIGVAVLIFLVWLFAPLRQALVELELALAKLYISIWLVFLPFILIGAVLYFLNFLWLLIQKPGIRRAQAVSRIGIRVLLLASTFLIDLYWGEAIRAFIENPKVLGLF